jgi:hypothetical protein
MGLREMVYYTASSSESRTGEVVWANVVGGNSTTLIALYSNTPGYERNLAFLNQWGDRAQMLMAGQAAPQSPAERLLSDWMRHNWTPGACSHVLQRQHVGFSLFLHGFELNNAMFQGTNPHDPNSTLVQLDCRHSNIRLLGRLPVAQVALARLTELWQAGAKPVAARLVQAGPLLLENSGYSGAAVVAFSFDPRIDPAALEATA